MSKKIRLGYDILSKRAIETESGVNIDDALRSISSYQKVTGVGSDNHPDVPRPSTKVLYIVKVASAGQPDTYKEWIWTQPSDGPGYWECTGDTTQDLSGYALKSEMSVEPGTGADADKTTITLKEGTSATVLTAHQDISGKADKVSGGTAGHFASLDSNGNLVDSTYAPGSFKEKGSQATYTNDSGTKTVDSVEQDADGNVTVTYKEIQTASTSGSGLVQLEDSHTSTSTTTAATPKNVKEAYDLASGKYSLPSGGIPDTDLSSAVQASLGKADYAIQHVYAGTDELIPDNTRTVTIPYAEVIPAHTVTIGGRSYKTVTMPDGNEWLAENLDYEWDNLPIGASGEPSTPAGWYYNDQKNNYGIDGTYKCGLLYNGHAVDYLSNNKDTLIPGWHVATKAEWEALFAATGGWGATGPHLKARDHSITGTFPNNWNGTDDYEFGVLPGGYRGVRPYVSPFSSFGEWVCYWTGTELYSEQSYYVTFGDSTGPGESTAYKTDAYYVRLVKDSPAGTGPVYKGGLMTSSLVEKLDGMETVANKVTSIRDTSTATDTAYPSEKAVATALATKQDNLEFDGTYNPSTNKVATESTVADAISGLSGCTVKYTAGTGDLHLDFRPVNN